MDKLWFWQPKFKCYRNKWKRFLLLCTVLYSDTGIRHLFSIQHWIKFGKQRTKTFYSNECRIQNEGLFFQLHFGPTMAIVFCTYVQCTYYVYIYLFSAFWNIVFLLLDASAGKCIIYDEIFGYWFIRTQFLIVFSRFFPVSNDFSVGLQNTDRQSRWKSVKLCKGKLY